MMREKVGSEGTSKTSNDDNGTTISAITSSSTAITRSIDAYIYGIGAVVVLAMSACVFFA